MENQVPINNVPAQKNYTHDQVLSDPDAKVLLQQIDECGSAPDSKLKPVKDKLVLEMREKYGYTYLDKMETGGAATPQQIVPNPVSDLPPTPPPVVPDQIILSGGIFNNVFLQIIYGV